MPRGYSAVELLVALSLAGIVMLFTVPYLHRIHHREKMKSAVREVNGLVLAARMQAVKRNQTVVLHVDISNRRIRSWADNAPPNFLQDAGEATINDSMIPACVVFRTTPDGSVGGPDAVGFDTYLGNPSLVDRLVFQGNGALVAPQHLNSPQPQPPSAYTEDVPKGSVNCVAPFHCRGIFLADRASGGRSRNVFRISVDDFGAAESTSVLKWIHPSQGGNPGEWNFVPPPWKWLD